MQKIDKAMLIKHMPTVYMRRMGFSFLEVAEAKNLSRYGYDQTAVKKLFTKVTNSKISNLGPAGVTTVDTIAVEFLIKWAMAETSSLYPNLNKTGDEYWQAVAEVVTTLVERTQPNFTWLHTSFVKLTSSVGERIGMPFMTVLLKTKNMYARSRIYAKEANYLHKKSQQYKNKGDTYNYEKYEKEAKRFKKKAILLRLAIVLGNIAVAVRNYERDKTRGKNVNPLQILMDLMIGLTSMIPGVRDVYSLARGYDIESPLYDTINFLGKNMFKLITEAFDDDETDEEKENSKTNTIRYLKNVVTGTAKSFGIGANAFERDWVKPTLRAIDDKLYYDYNEMYGSGSYVKTEYYQRLFATTKSGNEKRAREIAEFLHSIGARTQTVRSSGKRNNIDEELIEKAVKLFNDVNYK